METTFRTVALLLGMGLLPLCANAQKKVIIEDKEPNSIMFVSRDKAGDEIIRIMEETKRKVCPWYWRIRTRYGRI